MRNWVSKILGLSGGWNLISQLGKRQRGLYALYFIIVLLMKGIMDFVLNILRCKMSFSDKIIKKIFN